MATEDAPGDGSVQWYAREYPVRIVGTLMGNDALALRGVAQEGDTVMIALRRLIAIALQLDTDLQAARARIGDLETSRMAAMERVMTDYAAAYREMAEAYKSIPRLMAAMATAQQESAVAARSAADDCALARSAIFDAARTVVSAQSSTVQAAPQIERTLGEIGGLVEFLNQLVDTLAPTLADMVKQQSVKPPTR